VRTAAERGSGKVARGRDHTVRTASIDELEMKNRAGERRRVLEDAPPRIASRP
jgi:hypothetical protein